MNKHKADPISSPQQGMEAKQPKGGVTVRKVAIAVVIILLCLGLKMMLDIDQGKHVKIFGLEFNEPAKDLMVFAKDTSEQVQRHFSDEDLKSILAIVPDKNAQITIATIGTADSETKALQEDITAKLTAAGYTNIIKDVGGFTGKHVPGKIEYMPASNGMQINIYPQGGTEQL